MPDPTNAPETEFALRAAAYRDAHEDTAHLDGLADMSWAASNPEEVLAALSLLADELVHAVHHIDDLGARVDATETRVNKLERALKTTSIVLEELTAGDGREAGLEHVVGRLRLLGPLIEACLDERIERLIMEAR